MCPEGAATHAAYLKSLAKGLISNSDRVVLFNCATGLKYPLPACENRIDLDKPIDFSRFAAD
jgi:threonine synthase